MYTTGTAQLKAMGTGSSTSRCLSANDTHVNKKSTEFGVKKGANGGWRESLGNPAISARKLRTDSTLWML
jgi:hypothetical protein